MSCCVSSHYRSYGTFSYKQIWSIRSIEFYPLQKLQELVFVKEVYKSDKRKSQHIMLTFFLAYKVLDKWISFDKVLR